MKQKVKKGDTVIAPDPIEDDTYSHSFIGYIEDLDGDIAIIMDGDGDAYEIELHRLKVVTEDDAE